MKLGHFGARIERAPRPFGGTSRLTGGLGEGRQPFVEFRDRPFGRGQQKGRGLLLGGGAS